jgi:hypothetical protein
MPVDLTPKVIQQYDSAELQVGGTVRNITIVRYVIGHFGPFEHVFDRGPDKYAIEQVMKERARQFDGLV